MTTNDTILAALAEFAAEIATDLQNLSTKAASFSQRLQAVETTVQETKPKKATKKAVNRRRARIPRSRSQERRQREGARRAGRYGSLQAL